MVLASFYSFVSLEMLNYNLSDKDLIELFKIFEHKDYSRRDLAKRFNTTVEIINEVLDIFEQTKQRG